MLTAATIMQEAGQRAKTQLYQSQQLSELNGILSDLCEDHDLTLARGVFNFNFNPSLATMFGSGPYPLPLDYLRTSGTSGNTGVSRSAWFLYPTPAIPSGQPIFMVPIDLAEFDLFPQFPNQTLPELWATDMGGPLTQRIVLTTTAGVTAASTTIHTAASTNLRAGLSAAGEAITPGTSLTLVTPVSATFTGNTTVGSAVITGIPSTAGFFAGYTITVSPGFAFSSTQTVGSATILSVDSLTQVTASLPLAATAASASFTVSGADVTLSVPATLTIPAASVFFGIPPVGYAYPPPLGNYPVTIRYQRKMPPITNAAQYPWFPNDGYLIEELAGRLMSISGDQRAQEFLGSGQAPGRAERRLQKYLDLEGDKTNRSQTIQLDLRRYGGGTAYERARNTKVQGW
jgi:hypothetical protein